MTNDLQIVSNGLSKLYLKGSVKSANIGLFSSDTRVEAPELRIDDVNIFHRSTNDIIIFPVNSITGEIRSIGNVIAKNRPPIVDVAELYTGKLLFDEE